MSYPPGQPYQPYDPPQPRPSQPGRYLQNQPPRPPGRGHKGLIITACIAGAFILICAIVIGSHSGSAKTAASSVATATSAAPSASLVALSAGQQKFVAAVRAALSAHGDSNPASDAQIAALAVHLCKIRAAGGGQASLITVSGNAQSKFAMSPIQFVRTAEADVCPQYLPALHTAKPVPSTAVTTAPPAPAPTTAAPPPPPPSTAAPAPAGCYPLSNEGTCYEPGEYCRDSDQGASGVAGDGEKITCEDNDGWRWEPA